MPVSRKHNTSCFSDICREKSRLSGLIAGIPQEPHILMSITRKKETLLFLSALVITGLILNACGVNLPEIGRRISNQPTIKIAIQSPLSGSKSSVGIDIKNGAQLALEQRKDALEEMGFKVDLVEFDDQANIQVGVDNARKIVADPTFLCVVGHYNSGVQIASSEEYHKAGLANISPANTSPQVTDRGYIEISRLVGRDDIQGVVAANFAQSQGVKTVFIVHDKTVYGQGVAEFFKQRATELEIEVLGFEGTQEQENFAAIIESITTTNPELVYFGGIHDQAGILLKLVRENGYQGTFMGPDGLDSPELLLIAGPALLESGGLFYSTVSGPASLYPGTAQFVADFETRFGTYPQPFAAQAYDAMSICLQAIENAVQNADGETPTRQDVAQAIRALRDFPGITGTFTFNDIGDPLSSQYFIIQVKSSDPAKWNENTVIETLNIPPPNP
jgi:branched-chain amino acid transport system substrate-binding protein